MKRVYKVKVRLKSAFHINAGIGGDGKALIVKSVYTDEGGNTVSEPYIPASTLKGLLRSQMEMNLRAIDEGYSCGKKASADKECGCVMCRLFGKAGFQPSRVVLDNLYPLEETVLEDRTNVAINRFTRKAADGALVNREAVSAAGEQCFEGDMTVYYTKDLEKYETALLNSLKMIDSVGSSKSRGLGYVEIEVASL